MCGICGSYYKNQPVDLIKFNKMVDIITHRGPDDRGIYHQGNLALGHRRLAVIGLNQGGHQPFKYKTRYVFIYNGEIYNYIELRSQLIEKGYKFLTKTDTEVAIAMYDYYGQECVNYFSGMWSFCVFDKQEDILFCSRDRFGIKPFYYLIDDGRFIFSSEIKQILIMNKEKPEANNQRLLEFLVYGEQDVTSDTMFKNVKQLIGGHNLIFSLKNFTFKIKKYYNLGKISYTKKNYDESSQLFKKKFYSAIETHLRSDVPVGYCLSGGLDSSAIVCMADSITKQLKCKQYAISSCFEDKRYDEQEYIDEVIANTDITSLKIFSEESNLFNQLDQIIWHMDEPFGSTSIYAQWNVFEHAKKKGLTVMLDGQGADEQLAGYSGFYSVIFAYYLKHFKFNKFKKELNKYLLLRANTEKQISAKNIIKSAIISAYFPQGLTYLIKRYFTNREMMKNKTPFSSKIIKRVSANRKRYPIGKERQYILDSISYGMPALLHFEDRNSMAHSIESRVPFLEHDLVETIYSFPIHYKIRNGITKAIMRDGLKAVLPEKIRLRYSKLGFVTPEDQWINNNIETYKKELEIACDNLDGLLDKVKVMEWFDNNSGKIKRGDFLIWRIICAGHWVRIFDVQLRRDNKLL